MGTKETLEKIALSVGIAMGAQAAVADGVSGNVRYLGTGDSGSDYLETNLFYDAPGVDASCFTFLDVKRSGDVFGKTACKSNDYLGNTGLKLKGQAIHSSANGGLVSGGGLGVEGNVPLPESLPLDVSLTYFPLFKEQGASLGDTQKLEYFAKYTGDLPLDASLSSFGGFAHRSGKGVSTEYGEVNLKVPVGEKDSPFFAGYSLALIPTGKMKPSLDHRVQVGMAFEF